MVCVVFSVQAYYIYLSGEISMSFGMTMLDRVTSASSGSSLYQRRAICSVVCQNQEGITRQGNVMGNYLNLCLKTHWFPQAKASLDSSPLHVTNNSSAGPFQVRQTAWQ